MSDSEYDFGVPLPPATRGGRARGSVTFIVRNLPVNGSKFFPGKKYNQIGNIIQAAKGKQPFGFSLAVREVIENDIPGVRVWRIDAE
jgi:hypothetical protein